MSGISLTNAQMKKIVKALKSKEKVPLRLSYKALSGPHDLNLSQTQYNKIMKGKGLRKGVDLVLSHKQIKGSGIVDFLRDKMGDAFEWGASKGVNYLGNKIRGKGFFSDLASGGIRFGANQLGNLISGSGARPKPRPKKVKGDGFFSDLASGSIKLIGNTIADKIKGGCVCGSGLYAPGLTR
jgi:hypothetical protein